MGVIRAVIKLFLFAVFVVLLILIQPVILLLTRGSASYIVPQLWHWCISKIFSIRVKIEGQPAQGKQVMFMSNHISYLDIPLLGGIIRGSFVAKEDVERWALFGFLAKFQQTAFISRDRASAKTVQSKLDTMLLEGKDLIIFPEGTSTDGRDVYPFKSSLFSLVLKSQVTDLVVQPVTIQVAKADGQVVTRDADQDLLDIYAWHINMDTELGDHLWRFAKTSGADIIVRFHDVLAAKDFSDRKEMAKKTHEIVRGGLV